MRKSNRLPIAVRRAFAELARRHDPVPAYVSGSGSVVARMSSGAGPKRRCLYERSTIDGRIVERLLCDNLEPGAVGVLRKRRLLVRRRASCVRKLVDAGLKALPAWLEDVLGVLSPVLDRMVLVDDWAVPLFTSMTGYRGCPVEMPGDEIPVSFATKLEIGAIKVLLEQGGGIWKLEATAPGTTALSGPGGTILVYGEAAGLPVATSHATAGQGLALLSKDAVAVNCLSPMGQVLWDAWLASKRLEDADRRNTRMRALAEWAVACDPQCCEAVASWRNASPWSTGKAIERFGSAVQQMLAAKQAAYCLTIEETDNLSALWGAAPVPEPASTRRAPPDVPASAAETLPPANSVPEGHGPASVATDPTSLWQPLVRPDDDGKRPNWTKAGRAKYEALRLKIGLQRGLIDADRTVLCPKLAALEKTAGLGARATPPSDETQAEIATIRARLATMEAAEAGFRAAVSALTAHLDREALATPPARLRQSPHRAPHEPVAAPAGVAAGVLTPAEPVASVAFGGRIEV